MESANRDFFEAVEGDPEANFLRMSERMVGALRRELAGAEARTDQLKTILG